jgi:hypothetical protein
MNKKILKELEKERIIRIKSIVNSLLKEDLAATKNNLEWIEISERTKALHSRDKHYFPAIVFGLICVILAGLSITITTPTTFVSIDLIVSGVTLQTSEDLALSNSFVADQIYLNYVNQFYPEIELFSKEARPKDTAVPLELNGRQLKIKELKIPIKSELEIESLANQLNIYIREAEVAGRIEARNAVYYLGDEKREVESEKHVPPFNFLFHTPHLDSEPIKLSLSQNVVWHIQMAKATSFNFLTENPPNSGMFLSTIVSGVIFLSTTNEELKLRQREVLNLKINQTKHLEFKGINDNIHMQFEGVVSELFAGQEGFENNYMPTVLEYIYHNQKLTFFWSTIIFIWGVLWSIRKTIFKQ